MILFVLQESIKKNEKIKTRDTTRIHTEWRLVSAKFMHKMIKFIGTLRINNKNNAWYDHTPVVDTMRY